nr:MAG TPA: hypothetical protein [Caudoviricetes sp.]
MYNIGNKESGMDYTLPNSSGSGAYRQKRDNSTVYV